MYESKRDPLLPQHIFLKRIFRHLLYAVLILLGIMILGVVGNLLFEPLSLHDAMFNIALTMTGSAPLLLPQSAGGKVFFSLYGILAGPIFMATIGLLIAPLLHRILHKFHLDGLDEREDGQKKQ